ncbi:MAG TPA: phosphatase PAP2 family protein [Epsilonproteobacteria bacterium]|nr:phosphatase PAP2 family protein [Campylobacterota bacterium]
MINRLRVKQKLLGISSAALLLFLLIALDVIFGGRLAVFDQIVHRCSLGWHTPLWDQIIYALTHLGNLSTMLFYSLLVTILLSWKKMWRELRLYWFGMLGSAMLFSSIKELVDRPRPSSYIGDFHQHGYSFPSGHATMSMTFALLLFVLFYPKLSEGYQRLLVFFCLLFPVLIALSRVYLGVHYFSDILAGMTLGIFWVTLMVWVFQARLD